MSEIQQVLAGEQQTIDLARRVARYVVAGDVIRLEGDLGMGKSTFARAFIQALAGESITVPSPTFTIVQTYTETRLPVAHVDAYRLQHSEELDGLDLFDYFDHGVSLIEWPQNVDEALPQGKPLKHHVMENEEGDVLTVQLESDGEGARKVTLKAVGSWAMRFGLMFAKGADRPVTHEGRMAFLAENGLGDAELENVNGALSFRTYYRLQTEEGSRILMDAPPPMEDVKPFIKIGKVYEDVGVHVPKIYASDEKNGYLLLEDFGGTPLSILETEAEQKAWLEKCVDLLVLMANAQNPEGGMEYTKNSAFGEAFRYTDWYLPYETGHATESGDRQAFQDIWSELYEKAVKVPFALSHWDFHSDNLMKIADEPSVENIGVLDFQDARFAPITFDLACLLEDRWQKPLSKELKVSIIKYMYDQLNVDVSDTSVSFDDFMASYRVVMIHRMLKITGLFNRASKRDGRTDLPWDMPKVWQATAEALQGAECTKLKVLMERLSPKELNVESVKECA